MIILFLTAIMMMFTAQMAMISFSIQGLNRAIVATPIEAMYSSIVISDDHQYFDKEKFEKTLITYYDYSLSRYTNNHEVDFYYYNKTDSSMCLTNECDAVEISIKCKLIFNYDYSRTMYYEIEGRNNG